MPPRPILKALPSPTSTGNSPLPFASARNVPALDSPHVHFPPTPAMAQMEITHSPFAYDRKPIVVAPNACAMPARGERKVHGGGGDGGYFHPRAAEAVGCGYAPPLEASSMLFRHDVSYTYQIRPNHSHNYANEQHERHSSSRRSHTGHVPPPLVFDSSASESDSSDLGSPEGSVYSTPHTYQHQHQHQHHLGVPMDLSPFIASNLKGASEGDTSKHLGRQLKRRSNDVSPSAKRTCSTSRTRKVVSAGCTGFGSLDPGLEGCLGGF